MALKVPALKAAEIAIGAIGCGYDISTDLRLKYCKGDSPNSRLIEIDEDDGREVVLPGGVSIPNVSKSIKCHKGERARSRSDVLSFQQMSGQFNQELSLSDKIPPGLFNCMFEFSGSWLKDAAHTKNLAFDGVFITLYTVALEKSLLILCDHVKKAVPSSWDPAALARFIDTFGTHIIVSVKMGGKDVIYLKQQYSSTLQPADVQKTLKEMADRRFLDAIGEHNIASDQVYPNDNVCEFGIREQRLTFANVSPSSSYSHKEDIVSIYKRRGGSDIRNLPHNEWLQTVQIEPDVISMSFIPITSLLNGVPGSGFLIHAINLYLRYKPPIEELYGFLECQLPRQWAPFSELPLGPQWKQQHSASLQFSFMGPKLYVNTMQRGKKMVLTGKDSIEYLVGRFYKQRLSSNFWLTHVYRCILPVHVVDVGKRPVTGLRLYLEGKRSNRLAIHLQHLSSLPKIFQLEDDPNGNFRRESYDRKYFEKVQWKNFSHVCMSPVESDEDLSIVTGAQLQVENYGIKNVLVLRLKFSTVLGATAVKRPEWDGSPGLAQQSGLISTLISHHFTTTTLQKPPPRPADVNINSSVFPGGPPVPVQAPKLLKFVDTTEVTRGPQETPGYWVVSGARLLVEKGTISVRVKYSLLTLVLPYEEILDDH